MSTNINIKINTCSMILFRLSKLNTVCNIRKDLVLTWLNYITFEEIYHFEIYNILSCAVKPKSLLETWWLSCQIMGIFTDKYYLYYILFHIEKPSNRFFKKQNCVNSWWERYCDNWKTYSHCMKMYQHLFPLRYKWKSLISVKLIQCILKV